MAELPDTNHERHDSDHEPRDPFGESGTSDHQDAGTSLLDLLIVLATHNRIILGFTFAVAVLAAGMTLLMPNIYTATSRILQPLQNQSAGSAILAQLGGVAGLMGSVGQQAGGDIYIAMLKSRTVADNLIQRFGLMSLYGVAYRSQARRALEDATRIAATREGVITIEVSDKDPKRAAEITNAYVDELLQLTSVLAITEASQRRLFYEKQLKAAKDNLAEAEIDLQKTQESTGLIKLDEQARAIVTAVANLRAQIAAKEVQLGVMRAFATEKNPDYIVTLKEISELKAQLGRLERASNVAQGDILVPTGKLPEAGLENVRKFRDVKYYETMFEMLSKQYEVAKLDEAKNSSVVQVLDRAIEPDVRSKPERTRIVLVSALVAFVVAVLWVFFREAMDKASRDPQHTERLQTIKRHLAWW